MQPHTLETSIRTLKILRDTYHSQLDISVVMKLNTVIADLEMVSQQERSERRQAVCLRALQTVGEVIRLVSNISDLM
jgi:predicted ATPase with chaperone activity